MLPPPKHAVHLYMISRFFFCYDFLKLYSIWFTYLYNIFDIFQTCWSHGDICGVCGRRSLFRRQYLRSAAETTTNNGNWKLELGKIDLVGSYYIIYYRKLLYYYTFGLDLRCRRRAESRLGLPTKYNIIMNVIRAANRLQYILYCFDLNNYISVSHLPTYRGIVAWRSNLTTHEVWVPHIIIHSTKYTVVILS